METKIDVFFRALRENLTRHHADKALVLAMDEADVAEAEANAEREDYVQRSVTRKTGK